MLASPFPAVASRLRVRLEVRSAGSRPALYEPADGGFLIGSVPGCDLRMPGVNLPPVIALITRHATGATLRKLAPILPILVNGESINACELLHGDVITLGPVEVRVSIEGSAETPAVVPDWSERERTLLAQEAELAQRRAELDSLARELPAQLAAREQQLQRQHAELTVLRGELAQLRSQLTERFQERREKLLARQQGIHRAARKLAQRKRQLEAREKAIYTLGEETTRARAETQAAAELLRRERAELDERAQMLAARHSHLERREAELAAKETALEAAQKQHHGELVRLERIQAAIDQRQRALDQRGSDLDLRQEALAQQEQALAQDRQLLENQKRDLQAQLETLETRQADLTQRLALVETQQANLNALRARLEALRDELRLQEQDLADQRIMHDTAVEEHTRRAGEIERLQAELLAEREAFQREKEQFAQRRATLEQAVAQLRLTRDSLDAEHKALEARAAELQRAANSSADVEQAKARLADKHRALKEREMLLQQQEQQLQQREAELARNAAKAEELQTLQAELREQAAELARREAELVAREAELAAGQPSQLNQPVTPSVHQPAIVTLPTAVVAENGDSADRALAELLQTHELIDAEALATLLSEARRQRRSLRQLLLSGGHLTIYQLAMIEAGNPEALLLGPLRIVDKLPSGPREAVFRVYDPRHDRDCILRHLAESEMIDAVRPDEFRARFSAAQSLEHGNITQVFEVLEIHSRPAALVEWVNGLPSSDWPGLAAAPGAWFRLVCQAALALHAAHEVGLCHGHLEASSFLLVEDGTLKLQGLGEPAWLTSAASYEESPSADLVALGHLMAAWAATPPGGKAVKSKPLPEELARLVQRVQSGEFDSAKTLIEQLDHVSVRVPASGTAWERLLKYVAEQT
ncbi:MAG: hypothetical protein SNJ82_05655, partial [Gemmataceae bacterium]